MSNGKARHLEAKAKPGMASPRHGQAQQGTGYGTQRTAQAGHRVAMIRKGRVKQAPSTALVRHAWHGQGKMNRRAIRPAGQHAVY
jgi:hypothetical protein